MSEKVSALNPILGSDVLLTDLLYFVDLSAGTSGSKHITISQFLEALQLLSSTIPQSGDTALTDSVATVITQVPTADYDGFKLLVVLTDGTNKEMWTVDGVIQALTAPIMVQGGAGDADRGHTFDSVINGANAEVRCTANGSGWTAKTVLIRVPN